MFLIAGLFGLFVSGLMIALPAMKASREEDAVAEGPNAMSDADRQEDAPPGNKGSSPLLDALGLGDRAHSGGGATDEPADPFDDLDDDAEELAVPDASGAKARDFEGHSLFGGSSGSTVIGSAATDLLSGDIVSDDAVPTDNAGTDSHTSDDVGDMVEERSGAERLFEDEEHETMESAADDEIFDATETDSDRSDPVAEAPQSDAVTKAPEADPEHESDAPVVMDFDLAEDVIELAVAGDAEDVEVDLLEDEGGTSISIDGEIVLRVVGVTGLEAHHLRLVEAA
ncbi:hypothetical protein JSE7799_00351 [Jannaschia seosinensis]|uniref:Uncharacterized protein n=1 Tax=Jannaschia seosinensis TaxID=313367 RepID=A0A0M7B8R8_9RHOB|nr:hypothetical protein [Jannaschia seosinensis]CUH16292.1 hypothetical protein JSE7799_00351 [Jannaschia seosinensis]